MTQIIWQTNSTISLDSYKIPCAEGLLQKAEYEVGIRRDSSKRLILKSLVWPLFSLRNNILTAGFIKSSIGKWIKEIVMDDSTFLEIGCGDMSLRKYLPNTICYNAFDISLSEFHCRRVMRKGTKINIALASATDIPVCSKSVDLIASTEVFEHISNINQVIREVWRIAVPGAKVVCSIPNNFCFKYHRKGKHPGHVNNWSYDGFIRFMKSHNFKLLEGFMKGYWIPLPNWLTKTSYQLPLTSKNEIYCTNFFYQFEVEK